VCEASEKKKEIQRLGHKKRPLVGAGAPHVSSSDSIVLIEAVHQWL